MGALAAFVGIIGFILAFFAAGHWWFGSPLRWRLTWAALGLIAFAFVFGQPRDIRNMSNCYTDWDGRSNPTVCD